MKYSHPEIETVLDTENGCFNTLVVESQDFLVRLLEDICDQINGKDGISVLSENDRIIAFSKRAMLLDTFVPFDVNRKFLIGKIISAMEKKANEPEMFEKTAGILASVENFLDSLNLEIPCEIVYNEISVSSLLKAAGLQLKTEDQRLPEKLLNFMELMTEYDTERLFVLVNIRSYISDEDMEIMAKDIVSHGYHVIDLESTERRRLNNEFRVLIDKDLCEIV